MVWRGQLTSLVDMLLSLMITKDYGIPYPEELNTIRQVAKLGIILEPVYTGKTFYGMLKNLRNKRYKKAIFINTSGIFSIFAFSKDLTGVIRKESHNAAV